MAGSWNVGLLNIQTNDEQDGAGTLLAPTPTSRVLRAQREVGRSSYGAIFVGKFSSGDRPGRRSTSGTAPTASTPTCSCPRAARVRVLRPHRHARDRRQPGRPRGSDYSGRAFYDFRNQVWQVAGGFTQVGDNFNPEVGFLPRRGYRRPEFRVFFQPQPKNIKWIRRVRAAHLEQRLLGPQRQAADRLHPPPPLRDPADAGRTVRLVRRPEQGQSAHPLRGLQPRRQSRGHSRRAITPGGSTRFEYFHDPSAAVTGTIRYRIGNYYDGDFNAIELTSDYRFTARFTASVGWTRQDVDLPYGSFVTNLIPVKASYSFTNLASLSALVQYNGQTGVYSSNIRLALLNRSGTGLFVVYNDRRDVLDTTSYDTVGRSFVVKYTRLIDF